MGQRLAYWIFLGAIGFTAFFVLRPWVDFHANAPVEQSRNTVEGQTRELAKRLGFTTDSLNMLTLRRQHTNYYKSLKDSANRELPRIAKLQEQNSFLSSWLVLIGGEVSGQEGFNFSADALFNNTGRILLRYDEQGTVRRFRTNPRYPNHTFVSGDSLREVAQIAVADIFGYDLSSYREGSINVRDTLLASPETGFQERSLNFDPGEESVYLVFKWQKQDPEAAGPQLLTLELKQDIREQTTQYGTRIQSGASIISFTAKGESEPRILESNTSNTNLNLILVFVAAGLLIGLVFVKGILHINKGQVDWKRALFVFATVAIAISAWRVIYLANTYDPFISSGTIIAVSLNFLLFGLVTGLYGALAYIAWEAMARNENQGQVQLIDAFWRSRFFFRETGDCILRGYAFGGVILGLFALLLLIFDTFFYQFDSQFGFTEASITPRLLTLNLSSWSNAWLVTLGHVGVAIGFLRSKIGNKVLYYLAGSAIIGILFTGVATIFAIQGPIWYDIVIFTLLGPVIIYTFDQAGLLSFSFGWWAFVSVILITPYIGSESLEVAYVSWVEFLILAIPLVFGFVAYRYGQSVADIGGYIPEYQERMSHHLRMEKEMEIARESQLKLMPLKPPVLPDIDVYGFFLPSFEVGGDYYDYVVNSNGTQEPEALTLTIADVSGKAMKAAMHAVFTSGLLLSRLHRDDPASILREVSPTLFHRTDPQTFITCVVAQYHLESRRLTLANAGHCLPILKRNGSAEFIRTPEPRFPLGIRDQVVYQAAEMHLERGDFILFYSDGLPEAVDPEGNRFGFDTLLGMVEAMDTPSLTSNELALEIKRKIQKFSDYQLADDTTIICLKV